MSRPGYAFNRQELLRAIWGDSAYRDPRAIDVHIRHLREKLEARPEEPSLILTVPGTRLPLPGVMGRRLPAGLRWRLLLALVATSAVTLGVAALVVLPPLQDRLRDQSVDNLRGRRGPAPRREPVRRARRAAARRRRLGDYPTAPLAATRRFELRDQTDARVLVGDEHADARRRRSTSAPPASSTTPSVLRPPRRRCARRARVLREAAR